MDNEACLHHIKHFLLKLDIFRLFSRSFGGQKKKKESPSHAGFEQDSEPPVSPASELWFASQTLIPVSFVPKPGCQFEDLLCVPIAAAARDSPGGLLMVVSTVYNHHTYRHYLPAYNN